LLYPKVKVSFNKSELIKVRDRVKGASYSIELKPNELTIPALTRELKDKLQPDRRYELRAYGEFVTDLNNVLGSTIDIVDLDSLRDFHTNGTIVTVSFRNDQTLTEIRDKFCGLPGAGFFTVSEVPLTESHLLGGRISSSSNGIITFSFPLISPSLWLPDFRVGILVWPNSAVPESSHKKTVSPPESNGPTSESLAVGGTTRPINTSVISPTNS
jgi:hypothetical protein